MPAALLCNRLEKHGMGPTLASFASQAAAEHFAHEQGGRVLSFAQISIDTLSEIARQGIEPEAPARTLTPWFLCGNGYSKNAVAP